MPRPAGRRRPVPHIPLALAAATCGALLSIAVTRPAVADERSPLLTAAMHDEGVGYGGTGGSLLVRVVGDEVHVSGTSFLAGAEVAVRAGGFTTTVRADDAGEIHAVLPLDATSASLASPTSSSDVVAEGRSSDGDARVATIGPLAGTEGERTAPVVPAVGGALAGALPVLVAGRRRRVQLPIE